MTNSTQSSCGDVIAICTINVASASIQSPHPIDDIHILAPDLVAKRALAKFTPANIIRKPELPMMEMFVRPKRFAITSVNPEVISNPSIGRLQTI